MGKGWVTTARGESLNLDQLITDAKRPIDAKDEHTEIKKRVIPKRKPLNVRGFRPGAGEASAPDVPEEMRVRIAKKTRKPTPPRKVAYREGGVAENYADLTGVKLKPTEGAVQRRKAMLAKANDEPVVESKDELGEIMDELDTSEKPVKPRRTRTTKKDA